MFTMPTMIKRSSSSEAAAAHPAASKSPTASISGSADDDGMASNANNHELHDGNSFNAGGSSNGKSSFGRNEEADVMDSDAKAGKSDDDATSCNGSDDTADRKNVTKEDINEEEVKVEDWNDEYGEVDVEKEEVKDEDWNDDKDGEVGVEEEDDNEEDGFQCDSDYGMDGNIDQNYKFIHSGHHGLPLWADNTPKDCFIASTLRRCYAFGAFSIFLLLGFKLHSPSSFEWSPTLYSLDRPDSSANESGLISVGTNVIADPGLFNGWLVEEVQLDPFSFSYNERLTETFSSSPKKIDSVEDPIRNFDTDVVVNNVILSDVSDVGDVPAAKKQKIATPTASPTSCCNPDDYLSTRDPSAINIVASTTMAYYGSPRYTNLYIDAADDMMSIVANSQPSLMYNPKSEVVPLNVMKMVCNDLCQSELMWRNLKPTGVNKVIIYAHVNDDSNEVEYIGYSSDYEQRIEYHQTQRGIDYFNNRTSIRLITYDTIPLSVDQQLSKRLIQLWRDFLNLDDLPPTLRRMYENLFESWHRGGIKRQQSGQLLEIGAQRHHGLLPMAEAFMFDEEKENRLINYATQASERLIELIDRVWGESVVIDADQPFAISTWKTGASDDALSSCIVAIEYSLGNQNWENTFSTAIYPNAVTEEEIFTAPSSEEDLAFGLRRFRHLLTRYAMNSRRHSFVLVDSQDYIFNSLVGSQMELCELGYELVETLLGGEIIVFRKENAFALLHGHPAIVCDSRDEIPIVDSQRRAVAMDALRIVRQRAVGDNSPPRFDAIRGSIYKEISDRGLHGSLRYGAALCRDTMYPDDAIAVYGSGLTPDDINFPTSIKARDDWAEGAADEIEAGDIGLGHVWTMQRFTDQVSQTGVRAAVWSLHSFMEERVEFEFNENGPKIRRLKWRDVIEWYRGHPGLQRRVRDEVRKLPNGGDVAPRQASNDVYARLRSHIIAYNNRGGSLEDYRVLFVKKKQTYDENEYGGLSVFNMFTETNSKSKLTTILSNARKGNVEAWEGLITGFKSINNADANTFLSEAGYGTIPRELCMYKLVLPD